MQNKPEDFAIIYNQDTWVRYKAKILEQVSRGKPHYARPGAVVFPAGPYEYPCLVASLTQEEQPTEINQFCQCRVSCCFVYLKDAKQLVDAQAQIDSSILVDDPIHPMPPPTTPEENEEELRLFQDEKQLAAVDDLDEEPEFIRADSDVYAPNMSGALLLALVNEMVAIGAVRRERLLDELQSAAEWLSENKDQNLDDPSLASIMQRMWEDMDAGKS